MARSESLPNAAPQFSEKPKDSVDYFQRTKSVFSSLWNKFFGALSAPTKPRTGGKSYTKLGTAIGIVMIFLGLFWWFYPKAKVTIYVTPQTFQEEVNMKFSTDGKSNISLATIPAETVTSSVSGDKTKATSGTKTIGDKAKGNVQIQNGTAFPINLSAGTFLVSSGNLKFALDNSASVSAALSPSSPGTADVTVTADSIGADYNLAKDELYKVGNYPKAEVDGTATADFSGGSSQQISAVSKEDQTDLETQLQDELSQNAIDEISQKVGDGKVFVSDLADVSITSENFDHKVGDETDSLKLSLTLDATGLFVDKEKLLEYARQELKNKIPSGFVLRDSQIGFKFAFDSQDGADYNYKVGVNANFLPQTDTIDIVKKVTGKTPQVTESYLSTVPGFTRAEITQNIHLPGILGALPHIGKNITIEIVAER